jgi:diguanylate cyclase (GGDEF)-like protein
MRNRLEALVEDRTLVLRDKMREFEELATQDQLTGLVNRRFADVTLHRCIEEFEHSQREFSIALIDLDHFKSINDQYSHETGDEVLRRVARILDGGCREFDVLARYGGEEFLLCFPGTGVKAAADICETLRQAVQAEDWSTVAAGIHVSLSAGVAGMQAGLTRSTLLKSADARLYRAKHAGRNCVVAS